jgi:uncharacterized protein (TIGR02118 family)
VSGGALFEPATFAVLLTQDHLIKDEPVSLGGLKSFEFVTRLRNLSLSEFRRYWEVHGPLAARIEVMRRYVQSHCLLPCYELGQQPAWDGLAITWFDDIAAMRVSAATSEYELTRADEPKFLAPGSCRSSSPPNASSRPAEATWSCPPLPVQLATTRGSGTAT